MKRIASILLALIFCLGLASCAADPDVPDGYKLVSGDDVAYRFYAPLSWSVNEGTGWDSVYYSTSDRSLVSVTLYTPEPGQESIGEFWKYVEELYRKSYTEYTFIEEAETTLDSLPAMRYTFTANIIGTGYKVMQVIAPHGSYFYVITYTSVPEKFDSHMDEVEGMLGVFKFR